MEVLRDWPATADGDWPTLVATVERFTAKGLINIEKVVKGSRSEPAKVRELAHSLAA